MNDNHVRRATERSRPRRFADLGASENFCRDLTAAAAAGRFRGLYLRPVVHDQLVAILAKMDKPTVVLTGRAGVGKSCNVYALVHAMLHDEGMPADLRDMRVLELDVPAFLAGAMPGELERRAVALCRAAAAAGRGILLFIDEAHALLDARVGSLSLGDILKPSLARGEFCCIAATTDDGYRGSFETDEALARRFQRVEVPEPDEEETFAILCSSVPGLARSHGMLITPEDLRRAIVLAHRYVRHRANPDKANDLLDEAMALQRVEFERKPALREAFIERADREARAAGQSEDQAVRWLAVAEALRAGHLPLDARYLGRVIHRWTGLPTEVLDATADGLAGLGNRIRARVVGQDDCINRLVARVLAGLSGVGRGVGPLASAFLSGPTGVGKTETARALAAELLGTEGAFLRLDGSELVEPHGVARLIGSPPGYVGFDQGGVLTAFGRDHPFGIIVLDEAEKANRTVHDLFLQILEQGELEDGRGVRVDFSGHVVLFTSNIDLDGAGQVTGFGRAHSDAKAPALNVDTDEALARRRLAAHFRPELVNRFDLVLRYRQLSPADIRRIVGLRAHAFCEQMRKERDLEIEISDGLLEQVAEEAYHPAWGAREVRRAFDRRVAEVVARWLVTNGAPRGVRLVLGFPKGGPSHPHSRE